MKTAVSVPDEVFEEADRLAQRLRKSRSQLYSDAVREYVARHDTEIVTRSWSEACRAAEGESDAFMREAARRLLKRNKW